jgi:hypothetical protein
MKFIATHEFSYFTVYHVWATENAAFRWAHQPDDGAGLGQASYYKGKLKTVAAFNPRVVDLVWEGHYEWSDKNSCPDYWAKMGEWQKCIAFQGDVEWWCLHSQGDIPLSVKYLPLVNPRVVDPDTSVLVLQGGIVINDGDRQLRARDMHHIIPRPHAITIDGDAKVWLIKKM